MRSFVRARAVLSIFATILALLVLACVARADEPTPSTSTNANASTDEERFAKLKSKGDRALAEGRLNEAIDTYLDARQIKRDPLVAGRLGLAMVMWEDPKLWARAARLLHEAVSENAGVNRAERQTFWEAFERVRRHVCKVEVKANVTETLVDIGDGKFFPSPSKFWYFLDPKKYELIAKVEGRGEIRVPYECVAGKLVELQIEFPPLVIPESKTITVIEPGKETVKIVRVAIPVKNPIVDPGSNGNRLSILFGPNVVFGVAPSPAYGLSISGTYKLGNWSAMLGARGSYAFGPIEKNPLDVFTFTGLAGPCFREKWFFACGFASINIVNWIPTAPTTDKYHIEPQITPGIGVGVGGRYSYAKWFGFYANADATILARDVELVIPRLNGFTPVWKENQLLVSISLGVEIGR